MIFSTRLLPLFFRLFLASSLLIASCSSPATTNQADQTTPPDPAADSVADGLIPTSDTTIVDDDTLETNARKPHR